VEARGGPSSDGTKLIPWLAISDRVEDTDVKVKDLFIKVTLSKIMTIIDTNTFSTIILDKTMLLTKA